MHCQIWRVSFQRYQTLDKVACCHRGRSHLRRSCRRMLEIILRDRRDCALSCKFGHAPVVDAVITACALLPDEEPTAESAAKHHNPENVFPSGRIADPVQRSAFALRVEGGQIGIICRSCGKHEVAFLSGQRKESVGDHFGVNVAAQTGVRVLIRAEFLGANNGEG